MIVGTIIMSFTPMIINKFAKRNTAIHSMAIQGLSLIILFVGPYENLAFDFIMLIIYGLGYIAGPCGNGMMVDAIDDFDDKYGIRNDGMAFSFRGCATKIATAIANSVFLLGIIPLVIYDLDKPGYMEGVRERLAIRERAE